MNKTDKGGSVVLTKFNNRQFFGAENLLKIPNLDMIPITMTTPNLKEMEIVKNLGPLAALAGTWEGSKGDDTAPADDPTETEKNYFRERMTFVPFGPVNNHAQTLYGLKYSTIAYRLSESDSFHEEVGYWMWDAAASQVVRCFLIPRGISLLAGGRVEKDAKTFTLAAEVGSHTYGICSNPFLDQEFKTMSYSVKITIHDEKSFSYESDTQLKMKGQDEIFHHIDMNTLHRV